MKGGKCFVSADTSRAENPPKTKDLKKKNTVADYKKR